jgi:DNA-binding MarR family transcriptional regulator/GNAT superfamily N-acetyltransferase
MSDTVAAVRRFNRFYTRQIGALDEAHLGGPYGLAEGRVLYEVAQTPHGLPPKDIAGLTGLDAGYLSRILKRFETEGLVEREPSAHDGRSVTLRLTPAGRQAYERLRGISEGAVEKMIGGLSSEQRGRLTGAMAQVEGLLNAASAPEVVLRPHRAGDMGWVVYRQAVFYSREYGWGAPMEALVSRVVADFLERFDPERERCWIAERGGEAVGSIFLIKGEGRQAKLRLLFVEPSAHGLGVGRRLVTECVAFARAAGYGEITLWTHSVLTAARDLYAAAGFHLVDSQPHREFGEEEMGETWVLAL